MFGGLGVAIPPLAKVDWYAQQPTTWLLDDLRTGSAKQFDRAWKVILARDAAGRIPDTTFRRLVAVVLAEHGRMRTGTPGNAIWKFLFDCDREGRLLPTEATQFYEQAAPFSLRIRPHVRAGDPVPMRVNLGVRLVPRYAGEVRFEAVQINGSSWEHRRSAPLGQVIDILLPAQPNGRYEVSLPINVTLTYKGELRHQWQRVLTGRFTVGSPESATTPIVDEALAAKLQRSARTRTTIIGPAIELIRTTATPLAFDILARDENGGERLLKRCASGLPGRRRWLIYLPRDYVREYYRGDVRDWIILRSSSTAAALSLHVYDYLDCEIVVGRAAPPPIRRDERPVSSVPPTPPPPG